MKHLQFLLCSLLPLTSCDCIIEISGTIVDSETRLPLNIVQVYNGFNKSVSYTDTSGTFYYHDMSGACTGCPPVKFVMKKDGFEEQAIVIPNNKRDTTYLKRAK
jgi:hypothetical protein